jgi:hypothetical protein
MATSLRSPEHIKSDRVRTLRTGRGASMPERRETRRYTLSLPIETWEPGQAPIKGVTHDISSGGVYFVVDHPFLDDTTSLEFVMKLPGRKTAGSVSIRAHGRAVRVDYKQQGEKQRIGIAARIENCDVVRSSDSLPDVNSVPSHLLQVSQEGAARSRG